MPFENVKRDGAIFWLGEASAVLLADDLNALGLSAITRPERQQAFERLQVPPAAVLTDATVIRIGQLVGAAQVIVGSLQLDADGLVVRARSLALDAGRVQADVTERGPVPDLFDIFDRIARRLAPSVDADGFDGRSAGSARSPPVAAFENFIKGLLAETPATAINYLNAALTRHPAYDRARLALWDVYAEQGDHQRALAAVQPVPAVVAVGAARALPRRALAAQPEEATTMRSATYKALADEQPTPTRAQQPRRRAAAAGRQRRRAGCRRTTSTRRREADPGRSRLLLQSRVRLLGSDATCRRRIYWLREAVRRNPADGDAHFVLGAALAASGNAPESAREKELARRLSSTYEEWEKRPAAEQVPKGLERVKSNEVELPHARRIDTRISETGQRDQQELAAFYLDRARRLFQQENDREAVAELDRALYLSPYLADGAPAARTHPPAERPRARGHRRAEDFAVERGDGGGAHGAGRGVRAGEGRRCRRVRRPSARWPSIHRRAEAQDGSSTC